MFQLVYSSSARGLFTKADIEDILEVSREKNAEHGVTGVLLYKSGSIVQALEGEESTVRRLYANIQRDRRHDGVTIIFTRTIEAREFPDWAMGFNCLELGFETAPRGSAPISKSFTTLLGANGRAAALLKTFVVTTR